MSTVFNDDEAHNLVVLPPDGGWGYMVVLCSFICHFVVDGSIYSYGVYITPLKETFETSMAEISFVGAATNGMCCMSGPFVSACLNRYDFRVVSIIGCLVSGGAHLISSFVSDYYLFLIVQGFINGKIYWLLLSGLFLAVLSSITMILFAGIGYGMVYMTAVMVPSLYFAKWRSTAVALATCGTGIGTLTVPNVATLVLNEIGWRKTYLCMIGVIGVAALASLSFIPLQPKKFVNPKQQKTYTAGNSLMSFSNDNRKRCTCCAWGNKYFPNIHEIAGKHAQVDDSQEGNLGRNHNLSSSTIVTPRRCRFCWYNFLSFMCCGSCQTQARPMYRDDIFYGHSAHLLIKGKKREKRAKLAKIQKGKKRASTSSDKKHDIDNWADSDEDLTQYHMKVTHVTLNRELYDTFKPCCACHISGIRALTSMLDLRMMKSIAFLLLCLNGFCFTLGYIVPFIFVSERAQEFGIPKEDSVPLISIIGGANTVGRIISGILPLIMNINVIWLTAFCSICQGTVAACSGIMSAYWYQVLFVFLYGLLAGPFHALRAILVVDIFGLENLTNIFGLQLLFSGMAGICGQTIAGMLRDQFEDFTYTFYFAGGCLILSGILLIIVRPIRNWEVRTGFVSF